jgi:tetratricopeptide (TPR) repeat protein
VSGCATLDSTFRALQSGTSRPGAAERPELGVEYDVLLAELSMGDGDYLAASQALVRAVVKDPDSAYLEMRLSRIEAQLENLPSAKRHAERAVALEPEDEQARILLGGLYRLAGDVAGAERALRLEDGTPVSDNAALLLYQVYFENNHLNEALEITEYLVTNRPEMLGGFMALATIYERLGKPSQAERILRQALEIHSDRFVLYSRLARLKRSSGDRLGEIAVYREGLARRPTHYGSLLSLAEALVTAGDLDGAIETYESIVENYPRDLKAVRRLASLEFSAGRHERSAALLDEALLDFPGHFEFAYSLGQVRRSMEQPDLAMAAFTMVPRGDSSYVEARAQIISILEDAADYTAALAEVNDLREVAPSQTLDFHAAGLYLRNGDFDAGESILNAILEEDPGDEEALYQLGVFLGMADETDRAIDIMMQVLEINPDNAHALNYLGYTWAERGQNLERAEEMIVRALAQRPNDGFITDSLGWVYYMRGRSLLGKHSTELGTQFLLRARDHLTLAAELTGGDPVVSEHLGDVYRILNEKRRAYEFYLQAVEMDPREDEQPNLLEKLDDLRRELGEL